MQQQIQLTADGSPTIYNSAINECYHSNRGAIGEALHVYVHAGFKFCTKPHFRILEIGFGTGLNALLSLLHAREQGRQVYYETIEAYPVPAVLWQSLQYPELVNCSLVDYAQLHEASWQEEYRMDPYFTFSKKKIELLDYRSDQLFDVIYFDAFSPDSQPNMWTLDIFVYMYQTLLVGGVLLTYCSKGIVKQALRDAGFEVKRLPGAEGKRHMICAIKR